MSTTITQSNSWRLPPGHTSVYGWEFPTLRHVLFLRAFNPALPDKKLCCEVYLDKVLDGDVVDMGKGQGKVRFWLIGLVYCVCMCVCVCAVYLTPRPAGNPPYFFGFFQ